MLVLLQSPQGWQGLDSSAVPDFEAVLQELHRGTGKKPAQKSKKEGTFVLCIVLMIRVRKELVISGKKRLSRDLQDFL